MVGSCIMIFNVNTCIYKKTIHFIFLLTEFVKSFKKIIIDFFIIVDNCVYTMITIDIDHLYDDMF